MNDDTARAHQLAGLSTSHAAGTGMDDAEFDHA